MRPHPTEPGLWEVTEDPSPNNEPHSVTVEIERDDTGFTMTAIGETEPRWWPDSAMWRKKS